MKAFILDFPGKFAVRDIPEPTPGKDEIILRTTHCALCRTDARMCFNGHRDLITPRIPGHEICAVNPSSGIRYAIWPGDACGCCNYCLGGQENLCPEMRITGFHHDGGLSEMISMKSRNLIELPSEMPGDMIVFAEPVASAINLKKQLCAEAGEKIIIYGTGTMGLLIALVLSNFGLDIVMCDISKEKLSLSANFRHMSGIKAVLCDELSGEADAAVNATSSPDAVSNAFSRLRAGGKFCFFSGLNTSSPSEMKILNDIHYRQLKISGAYGCTRSQMEQALLIISEKQEQIRCLIHKHIGLDAVADNLESISEGKMLKVVVDMNGYTDYN